MWNEAVYPSTDEQIIEMWYIYTIDFYSAIKKKIKYETWRKMELENTLKLVNSDTNKQIQYFVLFLFCASESLICMCVAVCEWV